MMEPGLAASGLIVPLMIDAATTDFGRMQFDDWPINGLITIQSSFPAVRSIKSMEDEPLASEVSSHPPAKLKRKPGVGSQFPSISAPYMGIEIQIDRGAIDDFRNLIVLVIVIKYIGIEVSA